MPLRARPRGEEKWYSPERDLVNVWPALLVKSAVYAADPRSSINEWLRKQIPEGTNPRDRIRSQLQVLINVIKTGKSARLEDILPSEIIDWPTFQAIMFAAGVMTFKLFNKFYRGSRMVDVNTGGVQHDPVGDVDELGVMLEFDRMTAQF